jgi:hypothetical protein
MAAPTVVAHHDGAARACHRPIRKSGRSVRHAKMIPTEVAIRAAIGKAMDFDSH